MSRIYHILLVWYNTFTHKYWHRNKSIVIWTSRSLNLFSLTQCIFLSVLPKVHKKNVFFYNIRFCILLSSTVYIKTEHKMACCCHLHAIFTWIPINLAFKCTGLTSTHMKSIKLDSAQPNQGSSTEKSQVKLREQSICIGYNQVLHRAGKKKSKLWPGTIVSLLETNTEQSCIKNE